MKFFFGQYRHAMALSLGVHVFFFSFLVFGFRSSMSLPSAPAVQQNSGEKIIQAKVLTSKAIETEMKRLEQQEQQKQRKLKERQAEIAQAKQEAKQAKEEAVKAQQAAELAKLKAQEAKKVAQAEQVKLKAQQEKALQEAKAKEAAALVQRQAEEKARRAREAQERQKDVEDQSARFYSEIVALIEGNRQYMLHLPSTLSVDIGFSILADGSLSGLRVTKSSGYPAYDESALIAIQKAAPFSMPEDKAVAAQVQREIVLGFKNAYNS